MTVGPFAKYDLLTTIRLVAQAIQANGSTVKPSEILLSWARVCLGKAPILSIEVTRECPLSCPGCYAYGDAHLGGGVNLKDLSDLSGQALIDGIMRLVTRHRPVQVSLIGGEPLMRHRELSQLLPRLSRTGVHTTVVTSGVIPIPREWQEIPRVKIAVSVDGLPAEHDQRRKPATYERILSNTEGRRVDIACVVTQAMMARPGYLDEYLRFWSSRPGTDRIALSIYTPQTGEDSPETLMPGARRDLIRQLPELKIRYPKLVMHAGIAEAFGSPPDSPAHCTFSRMSSNYSADLKTRIEPCVFGGNPDCSQCGCAATAIFQWVGSRQLVGPLRASHLMQTAVVLGSLTNRLRESEWRPRWDRAS